MIRFHSKAGADILMLRRHADLVLAALGRDPAPAGIFDAEGMAQALAAFAARPVAEPADPSEDEGADDAPDLARRAWPLLQLLRRAQQEGEVVTWSST